MGAVYCNCPVENVYQTYILPARFHPKLLVKPVHIFADEKGSTRVKLKMKFLIGEIVLETNESTSIHKAAASVEGGSSERGGVGVTADYRETL